MTQSHPADQTIDLTLREVLLRLWKRRFSIAIFAVLVGSLALAFTYLQPDVYRAQAIVSIEQPRRRETQPLVPLDTLVQNYRYLLSNAVVQTAALHSLETEGVQFEPQDFSSRVLISIPRESQLLFIGFRHTDPTLAQRVANLLAHELISQANGFNRQEVSRFLDRYDSDITMARTALTEAGEALVAHQRESQLELLEEEIRVATERLAELESDLMTTELRLAQIEADPIQESLAQAEEDLRALQTQIQIEGLLEQRTYLLEQRAAFEQSLAETRVDLAALRESLAALERDMAQQPALHTLRQSIDDEPALQQVAASISGSDLTDLLGLTMTSETLNPVHGEVAVDVIETRAKVAENTQRETELNQHLGRIETTIADVDQAIYDGEMRLSRQQRQVELADEEVRRLLLDSPVGLRAQRDLLSDRITALTASIESMQSRFNRDTVTLEALQGEWQRALDRLDEYGTEISTATLNILERMPTLALFSEAPQPLIPESRSRHLKLLAGLLLGLMLGLLRAYLLEF